MPSLLAEATIDPVDLHSPYEGFERNVDGDVTHYLAGLPRYEQNFTRDATIAGILGGSPRVLATQLPLSALHQGIRHDPLTGEQPGQVHHQVPGGPLRADDESYGDTQYNACDTTPLFLIGAEGLEIQDPEEAAQFLEKSRDNLEQATEHIISLVGTDKLYRERPPEGSVNYPFRVTMWKDSVPPHGPERDDPAYPIAYSQVQFMAARGLLSASRLLGDPGLANEADQMFRAGIAEFMRPDSFGVYLDGLDRRLGQESSDELHALAYLPPEYASLLPLDDIQRRAKVLETPFGYVCTPPLVAESLSDKYHGDTIWPVDQALIHYGATKFGLTREAATARAIAPYIGDGQEHFDIQRNNDGTVDLSPAGCARMLWSVAARELFAGNSFLAQNPWL